MPLCCVCNSCNAVKALVVPTHHVAGGIHRNAEVEAQIAHLRAELLHKEQDNDRVQLQLQQEKEERERAQRKVSLMYVYINVLTEQHRLFLSLQLVENCQLSS